ncbi:hypothetical protein GCM10023085_41190 [Actinomadura viridis]|uniref:CU044_5270 family protein n=1 Tax=Actinomadura viridis TaxID=58110 RepID=A0A931DTW9_9ACTN|nr:hypothetical protein [Actinomadura viridis]MBG6092603.1 hypothetical protein [Actinomadura viridis]
MNRMNDEMDEEMTMVRSLLPDPPPPSARATAEALAALEADIAGRDTGRRVRTGRTAPVRRVLPSLRPTALGGLTGLVAAGAAAAVAVATLGGGGDPVAPEAADQPPTARSILLAAAEQAVKESPGRYWRFQRENAQAYRVQGKGGGYTVLGSVTQWDDWRARSASDADVLYTRSLGSRPLTPADAAAWKKAGAPGSLRVRSNDLWLTLTMAPERGIGGRPGEWTSERTRPADRKKLVDQAEEICARIKKYSASEPDVDERCEAVRKKSRMTLEGQRALANDPARFKELLFPRGGPGRTGAADDLMFGFDFLTRQPASPAVRAAAFRELAEIKGVRSIGTVKDGEGRTGIGLAARGEMRHDTGTVYDYQLILEPKTYRILAGQKLVVKAGGGDTGMRPGDVLHQEIVRGAGWTNEKPHHP